MSFLTVSASFAHFVDSDQDQRQESDHKQANGREAMQLLDLSRGIGAHVSNQKRKPHEDEENMRAKNAQGGFAQSEKRLNGDHARQKGPKPINDQRKGDE